MSKSSPNPLPGLVQNFFAQHLISQRQLSPCTVASSRDTFRLFFAYRQATAQRPASQQRLEDWDAPHVLGFLDHLEQGRQCGAATRNARLAALHCFMRYVAQQEPAWMALASRVLAIPNKRHSRAVLGYLNATEVQAILEAPPPDTFSGQRDRLLFQLLYNTGARVSELVALNRQDLQLASAPTLTFLGKGRKARTVPLWPKTAQRLRQWLEQLPSAPLTPVFANRSGSRLTRFGVVQRLACAVRRAARLCLSLRQRRISPHVFRHTTAMHLLQAGVDITAIALWLGHESPVTTHQYVEADLEMKKKTLQRLKEPISQARRFKPSDTLLAFLESL